MLDIPDLLALRLVSRQTKSWVDFVMSKHKSKDITLSFDEKKGRSLDRFMDERMQNAEAQTIVIPFGILDLTEVTTSTSFFLHPLIPQFLLDYGPKIHEIRNSIQFNSIQLIFISSRWCKYEEPDTIPLEELTFYQALPNLTSLSTLAPGDNVPQKMMPALRNLQLFSLQSAPEEDESVIPSLVMNVDFLMNCPNLERLWLPDDTNMDEYVEILIPLGAYFAARNGWGWGSSGTLTIFVDNSDRYFYDGELVKELSETEGAERLIKELAASDGRVLIDSMPITLLDKAVRLFSFSNQPGKLRSFGKCIRSLRGFSSSLYEVKLPNMRKMTVGEELLFDGEEREIDNNTRTVTSWPKLKEIEIDCMSDPGEDVSYMKKLLFGNVVRRSVKQFYFDMHMQVLSSDAAHLLQKLPNVTELTLYVPAENVDSFRNLIRSLPTSCAKLALLSVEAEYRFGDVDFLGEEDGELPPLLQLPGKLKI
jgi:hypothetical protein